MNDNLRLRQVGHNSSVDHVEWDLRTEALRHMRISPTNELQQCHTGPITCIDLDASENKYLLVSSSDCSFGLYCVEEEGPSKRPSSQHRSSSSSTNAPALCLKSLPPLNIVRARDGLYEGSHTKSVQCIKWYPFDNGLFVTAGLDKHLKVWDTNEMIVAEDIELSHDLLTLALSSCPSRRPLIAVGGTKHVVTLCDLVSGSTTHRLVWSGGGHDGSHQTAVLRVTWSPRDSHVLASSGTDGLVCIWDVRQTKNCLKSFSLSTKLENKAARTPPPEVPGLEFSPDGLYLVALAKGTLTAYDPVRLIHDSQLCFPKLPSLYTPKQTPVSMLWAHRTRPPLLAVPSGHCISICDPTSATTVGLLDGHLGVVTALCHNKVDNVLYSGGTDHAVLIWSSKLFDGERFQRQKSEEKDWGSSDDEA